LEAELYPDVVVETFDDNAVAIEQMQEEKFVTPNRKQNAALSSSDGKSPCSLIEFGK